MLEFLAILNLTEPKNYRYSFDLNVLIDGNNSLIPCDLTPYYYKDETNCSLKCYSNKGNSNITFFPTFVTIDDKYTTFFPIKLYSVNLTTCSVTGKKLYFQSINIICSYTTNQYFVIVQLYAKINDFPSKYSFNLYLDSPSTYYMSYSKLYK